MLALLGVQTTEEEADRRALELERLLLQVGQGDRDAFARLYSLARGAVYALALTVAALCVIITFWVGTMDVGFGADRFRTYYFPRMVLVGIAGLIGTGVALC